MKRSILTATIMVFLLAVTTTLFALPPGHGTGPMGGHGTGTPGFAPLSLLPLLLRSADLTTEQKGQISDVISKRGKNFRDLFGQLRKAHEALSDRIFEAGGLSAEDLQPLTERVIDLRAKLLRENMNVVLDVRALLTPEQLAKAADARANPPQRQPRGLPPGHPSPGGGVEN